jgi:hypothetical protein
LGSTSSGNTAGSTLAIRRVGSQVDVLLRVGADQEGRNIDNLLADADVALADEDSGVVDGLGKVELENLGLKTALHEDLGGELQDIIERVLFLSEHTVSLQAADERGSLKHSLGVLDVKGQKHTGSLSDLGQKVLHAPDFTLTTETIFTAELELLVKTFLLERSSDRTVSLADYIHKHKQTGMRISSTKTAERGQFESNMLVQNTTIPQSTR